MVEKSYYAAITKYYTATATNNIAWEAKFTRTGRIPFTCLAPHQEEKLLEAERVLGGKIADVGVLKKPFDGWVLYKATALFITIYFVPRATEIYEIPIRMFLKEKYYSKEKSLSRARAEEIGKRIYL